MGGNKTIVKSGDFTYAYHLILLNSTVHVTGCWYLSDRTFLICHLNQEAWEICPSKLSLFTFILHLYMNTRKKFVEFMNYAKNFLKMAHDACH